MHLPFFNIMNVLVYTGNGTSRTSVLHTVSTLKSLLGHSYDIIQVSAKAILEEPWPETCSMIVIPGGRDIPYNQALGGKGNQRIREYVEAGGRYLGICAGGYYGSSEIEFEKDDMEMKVVESRELAFYPGLCRGTVFPGFIYNTEKGARAVSLRFNNSLLPTMPGESYMYYNGGGYFANAEEFSPSKVQILAWYKGEHTSNSSLFEKAAIVQTYVGKGTAVLSGVHPEIIATQLDSSNMDYDKNIMKNLEGAEASRKAFLRAVLARMGLDVVEMVKGSTNNEENPILDLTPLYLCSTQSDLTKTLTLSIQSAAYSSSPNFHTFEDSNDTFQFTTSQIPELSNLSLDSHDANKGSNKDSEPPKHVILCLDGPPLKSMTPFFDIQTFFESLDVRRQMERESGKINTQKTLVFGNTVLYGEVVTSTQTMLDKNFKFSQALPTGFVCAATRQVSGRGRGRNSWISPLGCLQFSFVIRHPLSLNHFAPVVFIQYLISLAVVESIRSKKGYEDMPLRLKWPNDIYAEVDEEKDGHVESVLKKIGGVLVNSSFMKEEFLLVVGCGINLTNPKPTTSINHIIRAYNQRHNTYLKTFSQEEMLADILVTFECFYRRFCEHGFDSWFEQLYYQRWLHSNKLVTLMTHDNVLVRITGISTDFGMLETVGVENGEKYILQPDGNSFDMLKGLIARKS